jgi:PTS system mannose-specific IID component
MTTEQALRKNDKRADQDEKPKGVPDALSTGTLLLCLVRSYLVGAGFNTRGMQNIGFANAMDPGLMAIYGACPEALQEARRRYVRHYNTHPFWTPYMIGMFLNVERKMALGHFPSNFMENVRSTTMYTLSAIGDSFFSGSVLVLWSLATACLVVSGNGGWAVALGVAAFLALQMFKAVTFFYGFRDGLAFLQRLKNWDLINWGRRIKIVNGLLLMALWVLAWPGPAIVWHDWLLAALIMSASAWLAMQVHLSREFLAVVALAVYLLYPWLKTLLAGLR